MMKSKGSAFALPYVEAKLFIEIVRATECTNFIVEIVNIDRESDFCTAVISDNNYEKRFKRNTDKYVDIVFNAQPNDELERAMSDILKCKPEAISIYCNFQFTEDCRSLQYDSDIVLEFMLDENVFLFSCNHDIGVKARLRIMEHLCK